MTTRVKIELLQDHVPVVVEVLRPDGTPLYTVPLNTLGASTSEYVHSGQTLRVREMTTQELHEKSVRAP